MSNEIKVPIPSRVYNAATGGHVTGAEDIDFGQKVKHLVKYDHSGNEVSFASQLSAQNTIYVIHDDFTLTADVTIPANCTLQFEGGSLTNNNLTLGDNCKVINGDFKNFGTITCGNNAEFVNCKALGLTSDLGVIYADTKTNLRLYNCSIEVDNEHNTNTSVGCVYFKDSSDIIIKESEFTGGILILNQDHPTDLYNGGCYFRGCNDILVDKCTLKNSQLEGFNFVLCNKVTISNCIAFDTGNSGIATSGGSDFVVIGNHCYETGYSCITMNSKGVVVNGNIVHDNHHASGIGLGHVENIEFEGQALDHDTIDVICSNNIIYNSAANGITSANAKNLTVSNNRVDNVTDYGIYNTANEDTQSLYCNIFDNTISNCDKGVVFWSNDTSFAAYIKAERNTVRNATRTGIEVAITQGESIINWNNIDESKEGIVVLNNTKVIGNSVVRCTTSCLSLIDVISATIENNKFTINSNTAKGVIWEKKENGLTTSIERYINNNELLNFVAATIIYVDATLLADRNNRIYICANNIYSHGNNNLYSTNILVGNGNRISRVMRTNIINGFSTCERVADDSDLPDLSYMDNRIYCISNGVMKVFDNNTWTIV